MALGSLERTGISVTRQISLEWVGYLFRRPGGWVFWNEPWGLCNGSGVSGIGGGLWNGSRVSGMGRGLFEIPTGLGFLEWLGGLWNESGVSGMGLVSLEWAGRSFLNTLGG